MLRIVHIFSGVFWVGGGLLLFAFIEPTAKATAPAGQKFMQHLMLRRRFGTFMAVVSFLTITAGALLYWRASGGLQLSWITTHTGVMFTLGALAAITVFIIGLLGIKPSSEQLAALGAQIGASGQPPTPEQLSRVTALDATLGKLERIDFALLTLALLSMATAQVL